MRAVLDTSVLIAADVPALDGELAISAASIAELHFGVLVAKDDAVARNGCGDCPICSARSIRSRSTTGSRRATGCWPVRSHDRGAALGHA